MFSLNILLRKMVEREREKWVGFGVISQHPLLGACGGASVFSVSLSRPACGWGRLKFSWNMQQQQQPTLTRRIHLMDYRQCVCVCVFESAFHILRQSPLTTEKLVVAEQIRERENNSTRETIIRVLRCWCCGVYTAS